MILSAPACRAPKETPMSKRHDTEPLPVLWLIIFGYVMFFVMLAAGGMR